jgi:hypothetical protein
MMTHFRHYARPRRKMKNRVAAVLLLAGAVLTSALLWPTVRHKRKAERACSSMATVMY